MNPTLIKIRLLCLTLLLCSGLVKATLLIGVPCPIEAKTLNVNGGTIAYLSAGKGEPILLLHGLFGQKEQWAELSCELASAGFKVLAPDLPGYGKSTGFQMEDYKLERQALITRLFVTGLEIDTIHLAGSSMGGTIASLHAQEYPSGTKSLAFIGGPMGVGSWSAKVKSALRQGINPFIPVSMEQLNFEMSLLFYEPPVIPHEIKEQLLADYIGRNQHYHQVWDIASHYGDTILKQVVSLKPTLILWGADDGIFELSGIHQLKLKYPKNKSIVIQKASHLLMLEKPKYISSQYVDFLRANKIP
jgi:abhydrolase domain-containing protein 6